MPVAYYVRRLVSWFAHWIGRGVSLLAATRRAEDTFPDLPQATLREAAAMAVQSVETAAAANRLGVDQPLRDALRGREPPEETVQVRSLVEIFTQDGRTIWRTVKLPMGWGDSYGLFLDVMQNVLRTWLERYPGSRIASISITPPMWFGG